MNLLYAYRLLGVTPSSSKQEVRKEYLKMAKIFHPDKIQYSQNTMNSQIKIEEINEAYNIIISSMDDKKIFSKFIDVNSDIKKYDTELESMDLIKKFNKELFAEDILQEDNKHNIYKIQISKEEALNGANKFLDIQQNNNKEKILITIAPKTIGGQSILIKDKNDEDIFVTIDIK